MAVDPYIARGIVPLGQGLPEALMQVEGMRIARERNALYGKNLQQDQARMQYGMEQNQQAQAAERDKQEGLMLLPLVEKGDPRAIQRALSQIARHSPEAAQLYSQNPQQLAQAMRQALGVQGKDAPLELSQQAGPFGSQIVKGSDGRWQIVEPPRPQQGAQGSWSAPFQGVGPNGAPALFTQHSITGQVRPVDTGNGSIAPVPKPPSAATLPTEGERTSANYYGRMSEAEKLLGEYSPSVQDYAAARVVMQGGPVAASAANKILSEDGQAYYQAASDWVRAKLRKESGAVISPEEMEQEIKTYFPLPGDSKATREQKKKAREQAMSGMKDMGGRAVTTPNMPKRPGQQAPAAALEYLRKNPQQIDAFVSKYGYRPDGF